jgi:hypothetical protein
LLPLALIGDRAIAIPVFRLSSKEMQALSQDYELGSPPPPPVPLSGKPMPLLWLTGFYERDLNFYLQTMDKSISLAALPTPGSLALSNYLANAGDVARKRIYIHSAMQLPAFGKVIYNEATLQAKARLASTAFAVERYRLAKGRLPDSLSELAPQFLDAVPTDPFDGEALRYRVLARGYVIYSVGAGGHDDGGREPPENKKLGDRTAYDITFIVER